MPNKKAPTEAGTFVGFENLRQFADSDTVLTGRNLYTNAHRGSNGAGL